MTRLGDICTFEYGKSLPEQERSQGDVPVYGSNGPVGINAIGYTEGKTIIIGRKGSIGEIHFSENTCWPIDTTYFIDERFTDCDLEWLAYLLRSLHLGKLNKASGVPGLNREDAYLQSVQRPDSKDQQRKVAERLKARLAEVEDARQAALSQFQDAGILRTRVLAEIFARLASVERKTLGDFADTTSGSTPSRGNRQYWEPAEIPWVKTGEVKFSTINATEEAISRKALAECSLTLLPPQSVLVAMYGQGKTRGQSAILEIEATTNQACFAILPNETWEPEFLYYWLMSAYQSLRSLSENRGGNQANLNGALLNALEVPAPDKTAQRYIVEQVKAALSEIEAIERTSKQMLADIEQLPNRILAQAFEN